MTLGGGVVSSALDGLMAARAPRREMIERSFMVADGGIGCVSRGRV